MLAQQHKDRELTSRRTCLSAALAAVMLFAGVGAWRAEAEDSGTPWAELAKLLASDGTEEDRLGSSVSISGDTALVGAIFKDDNGTNSGSVYVFVRSDGVWIPEAELLADDGEPYDFFGESVALSGDTALVGAHGGDDNGADSGAAYVFVRSAGVWTQQAKLLASDAGPEDWFGSSVSISGETSLIGAYKREPVGAAYVFVRGGDAWTQQAKLLASDGDCCDAFGRSVSIFEDTALVGAQFDDGNGFWSGAAYVFARSGVVWAQQAKLLPNDGAPEDVFGQSVAVEGDTAVVGAVFDDDSGAFSGSAYIFGRNGTAWTQEAKLVPSAGPESREFGWSVSLSGDTALVGTRDNDNGAESGSAYVFTRSAGVWARQAKLLPADGAGGDHFGHSVSVSADSALIGAPFDDDLGSASGAAYLFERDPLFNQIFADGFESGDATAWSSTVP